MRLSKKLDCFVISDNVKNDRAEKDSAITFGDSLIIKQ